MDQPLKRILFPIVAVIVLLTACAPAPAATQNPEELQQLIQQSVAMAFATQNAQATQQALTLAAQYTETATQTAVSIPSSTPLATATTESEFVSEEIATDTPAPTVEVSRTPRNTSTPSAVVPKYSCDAFTSSPRHLEVMSAGQKFDIEWIIINTGTKTWEAGIDVAYSAGSKLTGVTIVEIPHEMKFNDRYSILLHAKAPDKPGIYYMNFTVQGPGCSPYVAIQVGE